MPNLKNKSQNLKLKTVKPGHRSPVKPISLATIRLQKYLAECGVGSRRKCEEYIQAGHVRVNGHIVDTLGAKVDPVKDKITFLNKKVTIDKKKYLILNKPKDYITTRKDPQHRKTIYHLLPPEYQSLHAVGRLDRNTTGLILLTNDGELTNSVLHPKYKVWKTYRVQIDKPIHEKHAKKIIEGFLLDGKQTLPAKLGVLSADLTHLELSIKEGRNRQIRKTFASLGYDVVNLKRISIGFLSLGTLKLSEFRLLNSKEIKKLEQWKIKS